MAVPKHKSSKARTRRRRAANMKLVTPVIVECPNCGNRVRRHRVCMKCGHYRGKSVLLVAELG